jgi:hypothetical protein
MRQELSHPRIFVRVAGVRYTIQLSSFKEFLAGQHVQSIVDQAAKTITLDVSLSQAIRESLNVAHGAERARGAA